MLEKPPFKQKVAGQRYIHNERIDEDELACDKQGIAMMESLPRKHPLVTRVL
jgi:hypothetical protein